MTDEVRYERIGAAAVLTIDRPERRNAVDGPDGRAAGRGLPSASRPTTTRACSSLTGAGDVAFCAGADLKAIDTLSTAHPRPRPGRSASRG